MNLTSTTTTNNNTIRETTGPSGSLAATMSANGAGMTFPASSRLTKDTIGLVGVPGGTCLGRLTSKSKLKVKKGRRTAMRTNTIATATCRIDVIAASQETVAGKGRS